MRRVLVLAAGLAFTLPALADKAGDAPGVPQLQGKWKYVKGEENGKPVPEQQLRSDYVVIKGNRMTMVSQDERRKWVVTYRADALKKPATLDLKIVRGEGKGKTAKGIYEVKGDHLKLCYNVDVKEYPAGFSTKNAEGRELCFVLQRDRAKDEK